MKGNYDVESEDSGVIETDLMKISGGAGVAAVDLQLWTLARLGEICVR